MSIIFDLERTNGLNLLPDKDLVDLCPPIEPYQVTKSHKFLNLKGTYIQGYLHLENIGIVCRIESKNQKATCPRCGLESDKLHQNYRHLVKDLPISGQPVYLHTS